MTGGPRNAIQSKSLAWQSVLAIGLTSLVVAGLKAWWSSTPTTYPAPVAPAVVTPPAATLSTIAAAPRKNLPAAGAALKALPPVSSFMPSRIAPAILPPELSDISRPPPDPPPYVPPIAVQPGYVIPQGPEPRDIR